MNQINRDIVLYICNFLSDNDVINFLTCCANFYQYIKNYTFNEFHNHHKVINKSYYDNFTSISEYCHGKLPFKIKKLSYSNQFTHQEENFLLPDTISYIEYKGRFEGKLPKYLIELKLERVYSSDLKNVLPNTLKYLTINNLYGYIIKDTLPESLEVLNLFTCNSIAHWPKNLTYLDYKGEIITPLPKNLISLTLHLGYCKNKIYKIIPDSVKNLYLYPYEPFFFHFLESLKNIPPTIDYVEIVDHWIGGYIKDDLNIKNFNQIYKSNKHHQHSSKSLYFGRIK